MLGVPEVQVVVGNTLGGHQGQVQLPRYSKQPAVLQHCHSDSEAMHYATLLGLSGQVRIAHIEPCLLESPTVTGEAATATRPPAS